MRAKILAESISLIRKQTDSGTINLNTNAYSPDKVKLLADRGLDSIRVSINSLQEKFYSSYFKPKGYGLKQVLASVRAASQRGLFVSLNLLVFPGLSDSPREINLLSGFLSRGYVNMVQWRNLCIDAQFLLNNIDQPSQSPEGVYGMIRQIRKKYPKLIFGYFNLPKERFSKGYSAV